MCDLPAGSPACRSPRHARRARGGRRPGDRVRRGAPRCPTGATADWREQRGGGGAVWARRGEVFAVLASGNAPGVHAEWPQALALGYRVAVRPSRREPFTGHRLVHALRQSGFRDDDAVFLPTDYAGADELVARGRPGDGLRRAGRRRSVRRRPDGVRQRAGPDQDPHHRRSGLARPPRRDRRFDRSSRRDGVRQHDCRAVRERRAWVGACDRRAAVIDCGAADHRRTRRSARPAVGQGASVGRLPRDQGRGGDTRARCRPDRRRPR